MALLLNRFMSSWQDSNLRPPAPKAGALPSCATASHPGNHARTALGTPPAVPVPLHLSSGDGIRTRIFRIMSPVCFRCTTPR